MVGLLAEQGPRPRPLNWTTQAPGCTDAALVCSEACGLGSAGVGPACVNDTVYDVIPQGTADEVLHGKPQCVAGCGQVALRDRVRLS